MKSHLILFITFLIVVTVHSVRANCEGEYTSHVEKIIEEMAEDKSKWSGIGALKRIFINDEASSFKDICEECDQLQKLSICIKAVQHKWKILFKPLSFTVNQDESDCKCHVRKFYGKDKKVQKQNMYLCPTTTMKIRDFNNVVRVATEPPFFIGQGLHNTQLRVRIFKRETPASIEGQLTGFSSNGLRFTLNSRGHYKHTPVYEYSGNAELVCVIVRFRETGNMADYRFERLDDQGDSSSSQSNTDDDDYPDGS